MSFMIPLRVMYDSGVPRQLSQGLLSFWVSPATVQRGRTVTLIRPGAENETGRRDRAPELGEP